MNVRLLPLALFIVLTLISCGDDEPNVQLSEVEGIWIHDVGNNNSSSDLRIVFDLLKTSKTNEIRLFVSKKTPKTTITGDFLESLKSSNFTSISTTGSFSFNAQLKGGQLDTDGDPIVNENTYYAVAYSPTTKAFTKSSNLTLSNNSIYAGKYSGRWGDNIFAPIAISGVLNRSGDTSYTGPVFISSNFVPTWGATENNGSFNLTIENGAIKNFVYTQHAPSYRGGCPGKYTGFGTIDNNFYMKISYIGDDCDGKHVDGLMELYKNWRE